MGTLKIVKSNVIYETQITNVKTPLYPFFCVLDSPGKVSFSEKPACPHQED